MVVDRDHQRPAHQRGLDADTYGTRGCPDDIQERAFRPAWRAHVSPRAALFELGELTDQLRDLEQQIAQNLQLARTAGVSWTQVGRAVGLSKQGAQQRWGRH